MAEAIAIGIVVSLLQQAIPAAISKLKARFQQAKVTEGEFQELEEFLRCVQNCSTKYETNRQNTHGGSVKTRSSTTSSFAKTLGEVQKTLESWSSQNSGFFSRTSSDRVQELQALRRKLETAISVEILGKLNDHDRMLVSILEQVRINNHGQAPFRHPPPIFTPQPPTPIRYPHHNPTARVEAPRNEVRTKTRPADKDSTHHVRSNSTGRVSTNPNKPPAFTRSRSKSVQRDRHHSSHRGEKRRTVDLWVSLDSEKQAKDVENKLMGLQDVKKVFYDLVTKKVTVMLGEGSQFRIATLLSEIQNAQPKGKAAPTRWLERPR